MLDRTIERMPESQVVDRFNGLGAPRRHDAEFEVLKSYSHLSGRIRGWLRFWWATKRGRRPRSPRYSMPLLSIRVHWPRANQLERELSRLRLEVSELRREVATPTSLWRAQ